MFSKNILVTGGAGFIGSNFILYFLKNNPNAKIINLDKLTYASCLKNLESCKKNPNYEFVQGDICDRPLLETLFQKNRIDAVIHFAAESHVDQSIENPNLFIQTNIVGTFELLDVAKKFWMNGPHQYKKTFEKSIFYSISTDEVYGSLGDTGYFTEATPFAPNSPYSASKASADLIVRSYFHTFGLKTLVSHCSNNYGPHQHQEKLIPTIIHKALTGKPIPIYGDGKNIRDWLFVEDHCRAVEKIFFEGLAGESYNLGGDCERRNIDLAKEVCLVLDGLRPRPGRSHAEQILFVKDRPGHDRRYAVDFAKAKKYLGWQPKENLQSGLLKTVQWYLGEFYS